MGERDIVLVLGGARSGKSRFAEGLVTAGGLARHYVATSEAHDDEMRTRIAAHRLGRGEGWTTHEVPLALAEAVTELAASDRILLVDCLTLWVSNLMMAGREVGPEGETLVAALSVAAGPVVLVSNEVGLGIVPDNAMARAFRDHAGRLHQRVAEVAHEVYFVAAGLPLKMKG